MFQSGLIVALKLKDSLGGMVHVAARENLLPQLRADLPDGRLQTLLS